MIHMAQRTVDDLRRLLNWNGAGVHVDWHALESMVGLALPSDYKRFVEAFPPAVFQTYLNVIQPFPDYPLEFYLRELDNLLGQVQEVLDDMVPPPQFRLYPDRGGLYPWGWIGFDYIFYWDTTDEDPDRWSIVICRPEFTGFFAFDGSMSECVTEFVLGGSRLPQFAYVHEAQPSPVIHALGPNFAPRRDAPYHWKVLRAPDVRGGG
jgi:hypothetical protein